MPTACTYGLEWAKARTQILCPPNDLHQLLSAEFCSARQLIERGQKLCVWVQDLIVVLDERGKEATSEGLAALLAKVCLYLLIQETELS